MPEPVPPLATPNTARGEVRILADAAALARAAAELFVRVTGDAVAAHGSARVALSGGSTPRMMGELLAALPYRERVPWERLDVFWSDERWVPESSPQSNAGEAKRTFLDRVPIRAERVHPFPTLGLDPDAAAVAYAETIRDVLGRRGDRKDVPHFDLILLGMGDDGHTASLFPGTAALAERTALVVANAVPKLGETRLTLTLSLLNAGRAVAFLVGGAGKADTLAAVLEGPERPSELPAQSIRPVADRLVWLVDRDAAARLRGLGNAGG